MSISAVTVYDRERLLRFNSFYMSKKLITRIVILISLFLVSTVFIWQAANGIFDSLIIFCFALVWFIAILYTVVFYVLPRFALKKARSLNASITYTFGDTSFRLESHAEGESATNDVAYSVIDRVMENKFDIYLFLNSKQCFIVDKAGFTSGTPEELIGLLQSRGVKIK